MKIGIDVDEVIVHFFKSYLEIFNEKFNEKVSFEELTNFNVWEVTNISKKDSLKISQEFGRSEKFHQMELVKDSIESIKGLFENHEIFFITSRPLDLKEKTYNFLKKHFPDKEINLHISSGAWSSDLETKGEICKRLEIDFMIEDSASFANECSGNGMKIFLLNKPWNKNEDISEEVIRVEGWKEILEHIEGGRSNEN